MELIGIAKQVYESKYKYETDTCIEDTWKRVAKAIASVEPEYGYPPIAGHSYPSHRTSIQKRFYKMLENFKVLPGGRITAGAGTKHNYLLNCCVEPISDSIEGIYEAIKRAAMLAKSNYGTGFDFSVLRPKNSSLSVGGIASGPVSFMRIFDTSGSVIETGGGRRAASIGILRVDHPDIFEFIDAKRQENVLTQFNISVAITRDFMYAVENDLNFDLKWNGIVYQTVKARDIFDKLVESGFMNNDPGLLFIDEVNKYNNGRYMYEIAATNPCGEIPLPPHGVCDLGNINLTQFIDNAFTKDAYFDFESFSTTIHVLVRFLDNVLDVSEYPFEENKQRAQGDRRLGLCVVAGLGSALAMLGLPYDSQEGRNFAEKISEFGRDEAYRASCYLAKEKGAFPNFIAEEYLAMEFIKTLPQDIRDMIASTGIRNLALLTVPPVGTGSLLAGNISNGLEPIFALEYFRNVRQPDGSKIQETVEDYAWGLFKKTLDPADRWLAKEHVGPINFFKTAMEIDPIDHIKMQAVIQKYVDGSISKTANLPSTYTKEQYVDLLWFAYKSGLKGFTTFREGSREAVLTTTSNTSSEKKEEKALVVSESKPTKRPRKLPAYAFQIPEANGAKSYITVSYLDKQPWEIFINKSGENADWYAAIGRLASRLMRKTGDTQGVIDELKEIVGQNGYFTPEYGYVESKPQHIAYILQEVLDDLNPSDKELEMMECPQCGEKSYYKEGGCSKCLDCGYSTCG